MYVHPDNEAGKCSKYNIIIIWYQNKMKKNKNS